MEALLTHSAGLIAMGALVCASAFCSTSEAALFSLDGRERRKLASDRRGRIALFLLEDPDRLLTAVLFWNLIVNVTYFAIASMISLRMERAGHSAAAAAIALGSLFGLILFGEMLPKSVGVLMPRTLAGLVAVPLVGLVRLLDPVLPALRTTNLLSRRLFCPRFKAEPHLRIGDLERAVQLSTQNAALLEQEQRVLQNIVMLSEIRVDELMRPRNSCRIFRPPVALSDLKGKMPPSGYLLVTEPESDEIAKAMPLKSLSQVPTEHLDRHAEAVVYVPWCTTVADALEVMFRGPWRVAAVINEYGETIGALTEDDILDTIFSQAYSRVERILARQPLRRVGPDRWHVDGMTGLRRLRRHFHLDGPPCQSVTVAGVIQEILERLPVAGDECAWGPFHFRVLEASERVPQRIELTVISPSEEGAP